MSNEITQEERERIIKELKDCPLTDCCLATALFHDEDCASTDCGRCRDDIRKKLIELIKSAPAKRNMRAAELADKLDKAIVDTSGVIYQAIGVVFGYDSNTTSTFDDVHRLADAIRNLDIQEQPINCIPLPTDKNGDSVDVGDVCFKETGERVVINRIYYYGGNNIFAFDTQDKKIKPSEIIKAKEPRNFYALKNELTHAVNYDTNLLTSFFKDVAAYYLSEIQVAEDEKTGEV